MFSVYFVFHYLNMFYVEKQVSKFFVTHSRLVKILATHLTTCQSRNASRKFIQKLSWLTRDSWKFSQLTSRLAQLRNAQN